MLGASLYITVCSARNRLRVRLRRLRQPRYLIGAVVGAAYLYFALFAPRGRPGIRPGRVRPGGPSALPPIFQMAAAPIVGLGVFVLAVLAWFLPTRSGLLEFSEAETEFLFPAPVSRRQLLAHRIVRSQVASLLASAFIALLATPIGVAARVRAGVGFWALLVTMRVYYAAVTLTRARLQSALPSVRRSAWVPIGLLTAGLAVVGTSVARQLNQGAASASDVLVRVARAASTGLTHVVLWPFIAILRPPFAESTPAFLSAIAGSLSVLVVVTSWMMLSDATFDAVAGEGGEAHPRVDERRPAALQARARNVGWTLPLEGRPESALLWKGAMETMRTTSANLWRYLLPVFAVSIGVTSAAMGASGLRQPAAVVSIVAGVLAGVAVLFGPQIMRADLRTDLEHLDLLKTWPIRAAEAIRGEMAWPILFTSCVACAGVTVAALFSGTAAPGVPAVSRWSFAVAALIAAPAVIAAQFTVHNAAAVFFPAWVQLGSQRTRGIDAMGQRLIMLVAIVLSMALFALPGALGGGVVWLIFGRIAGDVVFVPAAVVFAVIVLIEVLAVTELLGPAYDRIDVTSVERGE